jgi:signal transduction histidine kinase
MCRYPTGMGSRGNNPDGWFNQLNRLLQAVDRQAEGWIDRGSEDPQEDVARLEEQAGLLARLLDEFESAERQTPTTRVQGCDLNQVVRHTSDRWLSEQEVPMVLRSRLAETCPQIDCDPEQLTQAIGRALSW